jgi:hypothetical protein
VVWEKNFIFFWKISFFLFALLGLDLYTPPFAIAVGQGISTLIYADGRYEF